MKEKIESFAQAIKDTQEYIIKIDVENDGGSCNLDTVIIDFTGWKQTDINKLSSLCGVRIGNRMTGCHQGYRFVFFQTDGQASRNTFKVEAAKKYLYGLGINAMVWYKMD